MTRDFDAVIIGAGQAGPSLTGRLTDPGMAVALVERKLFGGAMPALDHVPDVMSAGIPYTALQQAVPIHPTVSELIPTVLGEIRAVS
ncbi:hypothetical protein AB4Z48_11690 [Cupriavidus sp. 2TAF22]|uniref:hypothetical protein n=1 Tax=unclassified Cupriavidus TaxID=2640874 RepID=UPI003F92978D